MATRKRKPLKHSELIDRLPRAFRPKLRTEQVRDLGLLHVSCLDAIASGQASDSLMWDYASNVLTWSRAAQLLQRGEAEMQQQLELVYRVIARHQRTGRGHLGEGQRRQPLVAQAQIHADQRQDAGQQQAGHEGHPEQRVEQQIEAHAPTSTTRVHT